MGLFGHALGDAYFMQDVEKIEVIRGPASVLYGSNAMGGAINIIPRHEHPKGFHLYAPITVGNYHTSQSFIRNTFENDLFGYSLSFGYRNSDGYRTDGNDSYTSKTGNLEIHSHINENSVVTLNGYLSDSDIYDPGQIMAPSDTQLYKISRKGGDITFKHEHQRFLEEIKLHYNYGYHDIFDGYKSDDHTAGVILTEIYRIGDELRVTAGLDLKNYGGKALLNNSWKKHQVNEVSFYAIYHQKLIERLTADAGLRFTHHSIAGSLMIPAIGLSANLPSEFVLKTLYSEGYRNPTINEMYLFMPSTTDLKQETTKNVEVTLEKQFYVFLNTSITVYKISSSHLIQKGFVGSLPLYQNTGDAITTGIEWEGQLLLPPRLSINWSASSASYSRKIAGSPGEKVNLSLRFKATHNLTFGMQGQWINHLYGIENPYSIKPVAYVRLEPYTLLNLNAEIDINKYLSLSIKIDNLLSTSYETMYGYPMPGRNFTFEISARY